MTREKLEHAQELLELIETTESALDAMVRMRESNSHNTAESSLCDGHYSLHISAYSDGTGFPVNLARHGGNVELTNVIIDTLESQLKRFNKEWESL